MNFVFRAIVVVVLMQASAAMVSAEPINNGAAKALPKLSKSTKLNCPGGGKQSHFETQDGSVCEVTERQDRSRETVITQADGSRMIVTKDSFGKTSITFIDKNGNRRALTR